MLKVLIDTNVIITFITLRKDKYTFEAQEIIRKYAEGEIDGYIAFHSLSIIWYVLDDYPDEKRREWIEKICRILTVASADNRSVIAAVENAAFRDFEDALHDCCADNSAADYIVTANIKDF